MARDEQGASTSIQSLPAAGRPVRVLVVDDNAGFRESLLALLAAGDLEVLGEARSGEEALRLVDTLEPDVVLMDVRMPEMDGIQTTRRLKQLHPDMGVVALSGHEDQDIVREMLVAGASGYVLKDSDGDEILNAVLHAALGGGVLSPEVTPSVIGELTEALDRERRRTKELEEAHSALVERAARRHELVARLSHELRTPVTVILGMAQTLARADPKALQNDQQRQELLERIVERSEALARLVERFELAVDAGLAEQVDVSALAREVASGQSRVRVLADGTFSATLSSVVGRRILGELVDNALEFSRPSSPVDVGVNRGTDRIEVRVTDRGTGIDPADRERIFGFLEQLEDLNVRIHQGVGFGLSLARGAARSMGGDVILESSGSEGSTFLWTIALED
jgi:DNA-binding NarL/FixJ family response regulator/anti-sigma regulatory factor (Ser/Thr protein kinase)